MTNFCASKSIAFKETNYFRGGSSYGNATNSWRMGSLT